MNLFNPAEFLILQTLVLDPGLPQSRKEISAHVVNLSSGNLYLDPRTLKAALRRMASGNLVTSDLQDRWSLREKGWILARDQREQVLSVLGQRATPIKPFPGSVGPVKKWPAIVRSYNENQQEGYLRVWDVEQEHSSTVKFPRSTFYSGLLTRPPSPGETVTVALDAPPHLATPRNIRGIWAT